MSDTVQISAAPPQRISMNYAALRESGMESIRALGKDSWTDHNVHDPGITLLEAMSYAMTELGLKLQVDVADLIASDAAGRAPDLEPAHRVLPCGPVTSRDLRAVLLDHPLVSDAQVFLPAEAEVPFYQNVGVPPAPDPDPPLTYTTGTAKVRPSGLYEVLIEFAERESETDLTSSNIYALQVTLGTTAYNIDLALPHWDEREVAPLRTGAVIHTIAMIVTDGEVWRALPQTRSFFGRISVGYLDANAAAGSLELSALLQITTELSQPAAVTPSILAAARTAIESTQPGRPVMQFANRVRRAARAVDELQGYLGTLRNLGEDAVRIGVARVQEIAVRARIEVTGGIDVEKLVAATLLDIDRMLSPRVRFHTLEERRATESSAERIYDGPLLRHGFLADDALDAARPLVLYASDVLRLIMRRRSSGGTDVVTQENPVGRDIVAVTDLALSNFINNQPVTTDALECLHFVEVERYRPRLSFAKSRIVAVRNDSEVLYDLARAESLFDSLREADDRAARSVAKNPSALWPVIRGQSLPIADYTPLQNDLPSIYGVGDAVLPDSAGPTRRAQARQLQGYLFLFEQFLGDLTAQLGSINRFFSGDPDEARTYFPRALFELPDAQKLLRQFPATGDWAAFIADPANPVVSALHVAAETREEFLDRRNRMLDHLLARQGEDAVAFGQELHRWARLDLLAADIPAATLPDRLNERREAANERLVRAKAALLRDVPELNALRLLAKSNPIASGAATVTVTATGNQFRWSVTLDGQEQLRAMTDFETVGAASIAAELAVLRAARSTFYAVVSAGGGRSRLQVRDAATSDAQPIAESIATFTTPAEATTALATMARDFATLQLARTRSAFERRVAHLTGIRTQLRRRLLTSIATHFEIVDETTAPMFVSKSWRMWEFPGHTGRTLLTSAGSFSSDNDGGATALVEQGIQRFLRYAMDEWNYAIVAAGGGNFSFEIRDSSLAPLARSSLAAASRAEVAARVATTLDFLYRDYGAEGFHVVEHLLLRPRHAGDPFLSLPIDEMTRERDPYSQRISVVFASGYARDFDEAPQSAALTAVTPDRFRDPEFRRHAERTIQQACPAHLVPTIYWVDRQLAGTSDSDASFDAFEARHFAWLDTQLIPGASAVIVEDARIALIQSLNAIANDAR